MSVESSSGFILWAVPRFRRSHAIVRDAAKFEVARTVPAASLVSRESETPALAAANTVADRENSEGSACSPGHCCAYH